MSKLYNEYLKRKSIDNDMLLLAKNKEECQILKENISVFLMDKLYLELNNKSRYYKNNMGINFCGYKIFETHILIRNRSKSKIKKNIKEWNKQYKLNNLDILKLILSFNSWKGHIKHANTYNLLNKYTNKLLFCQLQK